MPSKPPLLARIPVYIKCPEPMREAIEKVLHGEYEPWFYGHDLVILDIGANVGAFSVWANMRWPNSRIHAYEPHPETARMLQDNVRHLPNVSCHAVAVFPSQRKTDRFYSRYPGDGESGLAECMTATFASFDAGTVFEVPILHPRALPPADIVKLDVEGAEAEILAGMSLDRVSLVLLEFQSGRTRDAIKTILAPHFELGYEEEHPWDQLLGNAEYRKSLAGDSYGLLFFYNRRIHELGKLYRE